MKWPFRPKCPECDVRIFRDPKSGKLTLRLYGDVGVPFKWEEPILLLEVKLDAPMSDDVAAQVRDQLIALLPPPDREE
jgi:hypothetical protein